MRTRRARVNARIRQIQTLPAHLVPDLPELAPRPPRTRKGRLRERIQNLPDPTDRVTSSSLAWFVSFLRSNGPDHRRRDLGRARDPFPDPRLDRPRVCPGCAGPDDHYPDCLPASQGGTMPDVTRIR